MPRFIWTAVLLGLLCFGCEPQLRPVPSTAVEWTAVGGSGARTWQGGDLPLEAAPEIAWTREASCNWAVSDGERLYVAAGETLRAIRLSDGADVWQSETEPVFGLVLAGGRLYLICYPPYIELPEGVPDERLPWIRAVDAATGRLLWRSRPPCGHAEDILADSDRVYVLGGGDDANTSAIYALAAADGAVLWTSALPFFYWPCDYPLNMQSGLLLASGETFSTKKGDRTMVVGLSPEDGRQLWQREVPGVAGLLQVSPSSIGGTTLAPGGFCVQSGYRYYWWKQYNELLAWDPAADKVAWRKRTSLFDLTTTTRAGIATDGARIFVNTTVQGGEIEAFDLKTGWSLWESSFNKQDWPLGHPVVSAQVVMVLSDEGHLFGLAAGNGCTLWKVTFSPYSPPRLLFSGVRETRLLVAGGRVIVLDGQRVWALKPASSPPR